MNKNEPVFVAVNEILADENINNQDTVCHRTLLQGTSDPLSERDYGFNAKQCHDGSEYSVDFSIDTGQSHMVKTESEEDGTNLRTDIVDNDSCNEIKIEETNIKVENMNNEDNDICPTSLLHCSLREDVKNEPKREDSQSSPHYESTDTANYSSNNENTDSRDSNSQGENSNITNISHNKQIIIGKEPDSHKGHIISPYFTKQRIQTELSDSPSVDKISSTSLYHTSRKTVRNGKKYIACDVCNKNFIKTSYLVAHMRSHTEEKPFVCNICNERFITSSARTKHKRLHKGEKPFECDVCNKRFTLSYLLVNHKRTHTGEKPYVCEVCRKRFGASSVLSRHMFVHRGVKPHVCDVCQKGFTQKSSLKYHNRYIHDEA